MRRIHDGTRMGFVWQVIIFLGGMLPGDPRDDRRDHVVARAGLEGRAEGEAEGAATA